jgi:hypothetical protein
MPQKAMNGPSKTGHAGPSHHHHHPPRARPLLDVKSRRSASGFAWSRALVVLCVRHLLPLEFGHPPSCQRPLKSSSALGSYFFSCVFFASPPAYPLPAAVCLSSAPGPAQPPWVPAVRRPRARTRLRALARRSRALDDARSCSSARPTTACSCKRMHARWAVSSPPEAVVGGIATNDDVKATQGHHGRPAVSRPRTRTTLANVSGRILLHTSHADSFGPFSEPLQPPTLGASHHSRSPRGPLVSAQRSPFVCARALSGLPSPSHCPPCAHPMPHSQPQAPHPHMPHTRPHARTRLERSEHSNEDGTRPTTARSCSSTRPTFCQPWSGASTNDDVEATRGHHGHPLLLRLELRGGGGRSGVGGLRALTKTARANGVLVRGLNVHDPHRARPRSSKGANVERGPRRLGPFVRTNSHTFSHARQPLKPWSGRALPRATSSTLREDIKVILRVCVCRGRRGWFASENEDDGPCE